MALSIKHIEQQEQPKRTTVSISTVLLPDIGKSSTCHTDRRKNKRKVMEDAILTVLADGLIEIGANSYHIKTWPSFLFLFYFMHKKYAQTVPLTTFDFL
jgi:hypothetical protein